MEKQSSFRQTIATLTLGVAVGAATTLVVLRAMGIPIEAGLGDAQFRKFYTAYNALHSKYVRAIPEASLINGAIDGMTKVLNDPFTDYFTPSALQQFQNMLSSSFDGIGSEIELKQGNVVIVSVTPDGPAQKAGLKANDIVLKVNGKSVQGNSLDQISSLIQGAAGTKVTLTIERNGTDRLTLTVTRAKITQTSVTYQMLKDHVGYMRISIVADTTSNEVTKALKALHAAGATRLILDLRGNPGGYLQQAVAIAGNFIPKGDVVVSTEDRAGHLQKLTSPGPGSKMPIAVIMDQDTASAAEILSAALNEDDGAALVGTRSFGKGTVQETQLYADGSGLKYTIAKWLTPKGQWINHVGVQPTIPVTLPSFVSLSNISSQSLPLKENDNNSNVATLQKMLVALGYSVDRTDGYFDASTKAALTKYQTQWKLPANGILDTATNLQLEIGMQQLISNSDTQLQKAESIVLSMK